jgi:serine protease AprX
MFTKMMKKNSLLVLMCLLLLFQGLAPLPVLAAPPINKDKVDSKLVALIEASSDENEEFPVIVRMEWPNPHQISADGNAKRAEKALKEIRSQGGKEGNALAIVGGASGKATARAIAQLSRRGNVSYISYDDPDVRIAGPLGAPLESLYTQLVHAPDVWALGYTGQGVTVAVLDSGIAPVADLTQPTSHIITAVDFVTTTVGMGDPGGHGTHVAGIIAGNGTDSAGGYQGIAPGANLIDVRVLNEGGTANMSTVISGIQWVVNHKRAYNIRVLNISLGTTAYLNYRLSPLASAVEMAWYSGIVVVTSAGNSGPLPTTVSSPADDPFVISVGTLDDNQTLDPLDDLIPDFSAHGPTLYGHVKPDLVAPGRKVISLRSPGSYLDELFPERRIGNSYFRLTGTSMSAPVVSGIVALMLQHNPGLKPNQVKNILRQTTYAIPFDANIAGTGVVDAYAAVTSNITERTNFGLTPSDDFARDILPLVRGAPLFWRWPNYGGINWSNISWDNISWDRTTWENLVWENISWDNISWDTDCTWDNISWDATEWDAAEADSAADADAYGWLYLASGLNGTLQIA